MIFESCRWTTGLFWINASKPGRQFRGFWEGDTLVIETRHFNAKMASILCDKLPAAARKTAAFTERFTRVDEQAMLYEFILNDPSTF